MILENGGGGTLVAILTMLSDSSFESAEATCNRDEMSLLERGWTVVAEEAVDLVSARGLMMDDGMNADVPIAAQIVARANFILAADI